MTRASTLIEPPGTNRSASLLTSKGFTLGEMMAAITIMVVLLALLTPMVWGSTYWAGLARCGGTLQGVAHAVSVYAKGHRQRYPDRPNVRGMYEPYNLAWPTFPDNRTALAGYLSLNDGLLCPLTAPVEIENSNSTHIWSPYNLWFGVQYSNDQGQGDQGMFRVGDRFATRAVGGVRYRFSLLASDHDFIGAGRAFSSHPDARGKLEQEVVNRRLMTDGAQETFSRWTGPMERGTVDTNHVYEDHSVQRLDDVRWDATVERGGNSTDPRVARVPQYTGSAIGKGVAAHVPVP